MKIILPIRIVIFIYHISLCFFSYIFLKKALLFDFYEQTMFYAEDGRSIVIQQAD